MIPPVPGPPPVVPGPPSRRGRGHRLPPAIEVADRSPVINRRGRSGSDRGLFSLLCKDFLDATSRIFRICENSLRLQQFPERIINFAAFPFLAHRMLPVYVGTFWILLWGPDHQPGKGDAMKGTAWVAQLLP